jgi:glyoxylase-like metal-dependent hydrolase (beta-lactamase superfamily II)
MTIPSIEIIDTLQFGLPQSGAVYFVKGERLALIESGTAATVERTLAQLGDLSPAFIFLTHIHLDHAGGAGHLARTFPKAKIVVHERGTRHLADPRQLLEGVRMAAPDLFSQYGEPLPIPEHQLVAVTGGEVFDLGQDVLLEVVAAPGHAPHHVCFYEQASRTLFTGDAVGNWNNPVHVPLTVPPRFDLAQGLETLQALKNLAPEQLAFTHFGIADHALDYLEQYERQLVEWFDEIRDLTVSLEPADVVQRILERPRYRSLSKIEHNMIAMCVRGAILSLQTGSA